ncbi:MAG: phytanoyl-CoA dioxygenase family protein [Candidatus Hydrogenedentes bacterium]|nr:phytanoyl-CoA dioxygenase family protein [Candidatus Hydrogenedentota bacterium]
MAVAESLPDLSTDYALSPAQVAQFQRDGHILLRQLCTSEQVAAFRPLFREAVRERSLHYKPMAERDSYGKAFLQIMNLWRDEEPLRRFVFSRRLAKVAAELMEVEGTRLYHDQALYKEPGGGHTPWHQDQHYWPLETSKTITMWMPLVDITEEMGTMYFASGSHTEGYFGDSAIENDADGEWSAFIQKRGWKIVNHGAMRAGDATFHTGWTLHGASGNASDRMREVMTVIYYADGTKVMKPDNKYRQNDLDAWIPGGLPGEPAASPLNPLLYHR